MRQFIHLGRFWRDDVFFYAVFTIGLMVLSIFPLYNKIKITPPGFIYTMAQGKIRDFYIYAAIMRQGHKEWLVEDTTVISDEEIAKNLVNWYYLLLGKLGFHLGIPDGWMYYFGQYTSTFLLIVSTIVLVKLLLPKHLRRMAFGLIFLGGVFPYLARTASGYRLADVWPWTLQWESAYHRLMHVPAHIFAEVLILISITLLVLFSQGKKISLAIIASLLTFFAAIFFPPIVIPFLTAVLLTSMLFFLRSTLKKKKTLQLSSLVGFGLVILAGSLGLFIMYLSLKSGNPAYQHHLLRKAYQGAVVEGDFFTSTTKKAAGYFRIFWLFAPLFPFALPTIFQGLRWERLFLLIFWFVPFPLMYMSPLLGIESWRMANSMPFVTSSILAVWGVEEVGKWVKRVKGDKGEIWGKAAGYACVAGILALSFPQNYFYYQREVRPLFTTQVYIPVAGVEALRLLGQLAEPRSVVLSLEYVADLIPMYAGLRGYGSKDYDVRWYQRGGALDPEIEAFYRGKMSKEEVTAFFKRTRMKYVWYGWDEDDLGPPPHQNYPQLLTTIFAKDGVHLYQVKE